MQQRTDVARRVSEALESNPGAMTLQLARDLGVPEAEVVRALPGGRAVELDAGRWQEIIGSFEDLGSVHVIVSNGAATLEATGQFGGFSIWNEFFNVQTKSLDMHIRWPELGAVFAVEKVSHMNGEVMTLSVQFFDRAGQSAFKVFLNFGGRPSETRLRQFGELRSRFALRPAGGK
jgi:putative heme utilization carrier protein HutX